MSRFEFDVHNFSFVKVRLGAVRILRRFAKFAYMAVVFLVVSYSVFAIFFRTDTERRLRREIRTYEKVYSKLSEREALLGDAIASLQHKDDAIYELAFHSTAPDANPMSPQAILTASDTIPLRRLDSYARDKSDRLVGEAAAIDSTFENIFRTLGSKSGTMPPMCLPLKNISYPQVGASVGRKVNPFYKATVDHNGLDFIVSRGTPVYAAGAGTVVDIYNTKADGNTIVIDHSGGYRTVYKHLEGYGSTYVGQTVRAGQKIGSVGMSGKAFAPHLHYEVLLDGQAVDPVNHFFASVRPLEYANMAYMGANTEQSMD